MSNTDLKNQNLNSINLNKTVNNKIQVYFIIDCSEETNDFQKKNYSALMTSLVKKWRLTATYKEILELNIITFGKTIKQIITRHPIDEIFNLKLSFDGKSNYKNALNYMINVSLKDNHKYRPILISLLVSEINDSIYESAFHLSDILRNIPVYNMDINIPFGSYYENHSVILFNSNINLAPVFLPTNIYEFDNIDTSINYSVLKSNDFCLPPDASFLPPCPAIEQRYFPI